jgi:hypothetical protein
MLGELIDRDRTMPVEVFRDLASRQSGWADRSLDCMVLRLGRTFPLGPDPSPIAVWTAASYGDAEPLLKSPAPTGLCLLDQGNCKGFGTETL